MIQKCFSKKNDEQRYQYPAIRRDKSYFLKSYTKYKNKYKKDDIIQFLWGVQNGGREFQKKICIPIKNSAALLTDLFLHVYEVDFLQELLNNKDRKLAKP